MPHICGAGHILSFCVSKVSVSPQTTKNQMKHNRIIMGHRGELSWRMKRLRQKKGSAEKRLPDQCSSPWNWSLDGWTSFNFWNCSGKEGKLIAALYFKRNWSLQSKYGWLSWPSCMLALGTLLLMWDSFANHFKYLTQTSISVRLCILIFHIRDLL